MESRIESSISFESAPADAEFIPNFHQVLARGRGSEYGRRRLRRSRNSECLRNQKSPLLRQVRRESTASSIPCFFCVRVCNLSRRVTRPRTEGSILLNAVMQPREEKAVAASSHNFPSVCGTQQFSRVRNLKTEKLSSWWGLWC